MSTLIKTAHKLTVITGLSLVLGAGISAFKSGMIQSSGIFHPSQPSEVLSQSNQPDPAAQSEVETNLGTVAIDSPPTAEPTPAQPAAEPKPAPVSPPAKPPAAAAASTPLVDGAAASLAFVNGVRAENGKPPLALDAVLNAYALTHATNMANQCQLYHQNISLIMNKNDANGKKMFSVAENVAYSSASLTQALNVLKGSPGHFENITGDYNRVGFGVVVSGATACKGHVYTAQVFAKS